MKITFPHSIWKPIVGISILLMLFTTVNLDHLIKIIKNSSPIWLVPAAIMLTASTMLGCFTLRSIMKHKINIGYPSFLKGYWTAWAFGLVVPGQIGDIASISIWMKKKGYALIFAGTNAIIDKLITLFWMILISTLSLAHTFEIVNSKIQISPKLSVSFVLALLFLVALTTLLLRRQLAMITSDIVCVIKNILSCNLNGLSNNFLLTPIKIVFISLSYWFTFRAYGYSINITTLIPIVCFCSLVAYIPISLNGLGTVEWVASTIFLAKSVPLEATLATYLTLRALVLILAWSPVLFFQLSTILPLKRKTS